MYSSECVDFTRNKANIALLGAGTSLCLATVAIGLATFSQDQQSCPAQLPPNEFLTTTPTESMPNPAAHIGAKVLNCIQNGQQYELRMIENS